MRRSRHAGSLSGRTGQRKTARTAFQAAVTGSRTAGRRLLGRRHAPLRPVWASCRRRRETVRWFRVPVPAVPRAVDPELLYVECGHCGAPVIWEPGRMTRLLRQAGVDPLELSASCVLLTDGCPICRPSSLYSVQIFRVSNAREGLLPLLAGHA